MELSKIISRLSLLDPENIESVSFDKNDDSVKEICFKFNDLKLKPSEYDDLTVKFNSLKIFSSIDISENSSSIKNIESLIPGLEKQLVAKNKNNKLSNTFHKYNGELNYTINNKNFIYKFPINCNSKFKPNNKRKTRKLAIKSIGKKLADNLSLRKFKNNNVIFV